MLHVIYCRSKSLRIFRQSPINASSLDMLGNHAFFPLPFSQDTGAGLRHCFMNRSMAGGGKVQYKKLCPNSILHIKSKWSLLEI